MMVEVTACKSGVIKATKTSEGERERERDTTLVSEHHNKQVKKVNTAGCELSAEYRSVQKQSEQRGHHLTKGSNSRFSQCWEVTEGK